jgi:hypothetical protein
MPETPNTPARAQFRATRPSGPASDPPWCDDKPGTSPDIDDLDEQLHALMARGFSFAHPCHPSGEIVAVVGVRTHHDVIDIVQLLDEHNADAARVPNDEPNILFPRRVMWRATGPAHEVLKRILDLDDNGPTTTDASCRGWWISTSPDRAQVTCVPRT